MNNVGDNDDPMVRNRNTILCIMQIVAIYNAISLGWKVKKIGIRKYKLSKQITLLTNTDNDNLSNLTNFVNILTSKAKFKL